MFNRKIKSKVIFKVILILLIAVLTFATIPAKSYAALTLKYTYNEQQYYSWVGIPILKIMILKKAIKN